MSELTRKELEEIAAKSEIAAEIFLGEFLRGGLPPEEIRAEFEGLLPYLPTMLRAVDEAIGLQCAARVEGAPSLLDDLPAVDPETVEWAAGQIAQIMVHERVHPEAVQTDVVGQSAIKLAEKMNAIVARYLEAMEREELSPTAFRSHFESALPAIRLELRQWLRLDEAAVLNYDPSAEDVDLSALERNAELFEWAADTVHAVFMEENERIEEEGEDPGGA